MSWRRSLGALALLLLLAAPARAAVSCTGVGSDTGTGTTDSMSVTVAAGSDRALFVFLTSDVAGTALSPSFTFNGDAGTQIGEGEAGYYVWAGVLVAPDVGTFTLALSGAYSGEVHQWAAVSCTGVDQTTPTGAANVVTGNAEGSTSGAIASATDNLVLSAASANNLTAPAFASTGTGQTELYDLGDGNAGLSVAQSTGAASVVASYTWTDPRLFSQITFDVKVPSGSGGGGGNLACSGAGSDSGAGATDSFSVTVATGTDRVMFVSVGADVQGTYTPAVDFNSDTLTQIGENEGNYYHWVGRLIAPDEGSFTLSFSGLPVEAHQIAVIVCTGADQTTPNDTSDVVASSGVGSASNAITSATGNIVLSFVAYNNHSAGAATSTGTGQTEIYDLGDSDVALSAAQSTGAASVVASYTWNDTVLFTQVTFDVNPSEGEPPPASTCRGALLLLGVGGC